MKVQITVDCDQLPNSGSRPDVAKVLRDIANTLEGGDSWSFAPSGHFINGAKVASVKLLMDTTKIAD